MEETTKNDIKNGRIYCIRNNINDNVYIGSTAQSLSKRFQTHKSDFNNPKKNNFKFYQHMSEIGVEQFYIELVEEYACENIEQLRRREGERIRKMATLNTKVAGRTTIEYRQETKDNKKEYDKLYSEANKGKKKEQAKIRYENQKEEIEPKN